MENLGKIGIDKVTGFKGVILAKASYLYELDKYLIQPIDLDGSDDIIKNSQWLSCKRIEIEENPSSKTIGFINESDYNVEVCSIESEDELG